MDGKKAVSVMSVSRVFAVFEHSKVFFVLGAPIYRSYRELTVDRRMTAGAPVRSRTRSKLGSG